MELIFEIIFRRLIVHLFGVNTRYFFFKLIGNEKSRSYLSGEKGNDTTQQFSQSMISFFLGMISFAAFSFLVVFILYELGIDF